MYENLGGNSRTVMLATISPASIHLDETLATLRYACQARSIVNRVKVNEDPHDRIIRELRAEVERLQVLRQDYERQKRLSEANQHHHPPRKIIIETSVDDSEVEALRQQLAETEQELAKAQRSWRERLQEAEDVRRTEMKLLKRKGLALELSAEQKEPCLVNLATDPMLSGTLLYIIPPGTVKIGRPSSLSTPDIVLEGPLVSPNHCSIENRNGKLFLLPETSTEYETFVNGELVQERRQLFHGDRLVIGGSHYFRISNPLCPNKSNTQIMVDFQLAHQEILQEQENRLRRELDVEKKAAIARIEAERMAHEQEYEERLASLELEKFKYKCHKELLETEKEALLQSASKQNSKCDGRKARPSDVRDSLDLTPSAAESNLADEIRRIMEHTSEESLAHIQMMVKEASQRCRTVGLDYEFKQTQVWQDEGIFRAMINIVDRPNGRIAEWVPARLEYWLGIVRERDDLTADNMFEHFDLVWNEPGDQSANESLLQDSHNSSRISLNLSSVIRGRNSIVSNPGSPSTATSGSTRKSQGLFKSIFSKPTTSLMPAGEDSERGFGRPASARKALFTDADSNDENVPSNNQQLPSATASQSKATVLHRFDQKAANYLKDLYGATLKLRKLCEKYQDSDAPPTTDGEESLLAGKEGRSSNAEERLASKCLESVADIERSLQTIRSVLADHNIKEATISAMEGEFGRTPKSVRLERDVVAHRYQLAVEVFVVERVLLQHHRAAGQQVRQPVRRHRTVHIHLIAIVEEFVHGNVSNTRSKLALLVAEEEKVGKRRIQQLRVAARQRYQLQSLPSRIPPAPESFGVFVGPRQSTPLDGQHVEHYAAHILERRFGNVVRRHNNVERIVTSAPGKDWIRPGRAAWATLLHQRPITEIDKHFHIGQGKFARQRQQDRVHKLAEAGVLPVATPVHLVAQNHVVAVRNAARFVVLLDHPGAQAGKVDGPKRNQVHIDLWIACRAADRFKPLFHGTLRTVALLGVQCAGDGERRPGQMGFVVAHVYRDVTARFGQPVANDARPIMAIDLIQPIPARAEPGLSNDTRLFFGSTVALPQEAK
uniref:Kinesin motor domain-containing protein n=1 Tax=Anopheles melas TaxID=34690 RepID=A0A182TD46_9DIPT